MFPKHKLDPSVTVWLDKLDEIPQLSKNVEDSSLDAFQKEAIAFLVKSQRGLLGLAPRLGKTPVSLLAAQEFGGNTLVVCPFPLLYAWKREIKKWVGAESEIWHGYLGYGYENWIVTNYNTVLNCMVRFDEKIEEKDGKKRKIRINWRPVEQFMFDNVIIDESVLIKNRKAQRSLAINTLTNKLKSVKRVFLLSGNPITKFYDDLWYQFHVIDPKRFPAYWRFAEEFCVVENKFWGTSITNNKSDAAQRIHREFKDIYFARTAEQVGLPPGWTFDILDIPMEATQKRLYAEMETGFVAELPDGDKLVAPNILAQITRLVQLASNPLLVGGPDIHPKWSAVVDLLEYEEKPAIVWTNFIATANALQKLLKSKKYIARVLTGEVNNNDRDTYVQEFQSGMVDVIVAHPGVGKFGLTLNAAKTAIYVERSYNGDDYYQSLHRVILARVPSSPHIIILRSNYTEEVDGNVVEKPTIDHVIHKVLGFKLENSIQITTGLIREVLGV
jgi:SNF2 family DNA or RNA helicase